MNKFFKRLSVVLTALIAVVCLAAFAACDKGNEDGGNNYATTTVAITVKDENGNLINGATFGEGDYDSSVTQVSIQFCIAGEDGACMQPVNVGADGKASISYTDMHDTVLQFPDATESTMIELHVLNVEAKGYKKAYGQYKLNEVPATIEITLVKA